MRQQAVIKQDISQKRWNEMLLKDLKKNTNVYIMAVPVLLFYLLFCYFPMYGALIAFKEYDIGSGFLGSPWVGLQQFKDFFSSFYFWRLLRNTLLISVYSIAFGFPAPILLALSMNEIRQNIFKKTVQMITYLPHFLSIIVVCGMLTNFLGREGIITNMLVSLGVTRDNLLGVKENFRFIYVSSDIWQELGWGSILYLAALSGIDMQLYEAAKIDGAGRWRQLFNITIPGILPTITIMFILRIGQLMNIGFEKVMLLYTPQTYETSDVISTFVYRQGLVEGFKYSYSTAIGLFNSVINFILLIAANTISRRFTDDSLW